MTKRTRRSSATVLALAAMGLTACTGQAAPEWVPSPSGSPSGSPEAAAAPELEITPDDGATGALLSTEIGTETDGEVTAVTVTAEGGDEVEGRMRDDGTSWVPARPLAPTSEYTATVTATGDGGRSVSAETSFTTMAAPGRRTGTGLYLFDGRTYGVAMPVVVEFVQPVPEDARADVQRRMFVRTDPPQPGVWHWVPDGSQAFYRGPEYWQPGTELDVRIALDGHATGDGRYGDTDRSATVTIGDRTEIEVSNQDKELSVYRDGELARTVPVSLGKASTPSSSGRMVVMSRERETVFDTYDELGPEEGYRMDITYAMRLTWGGEYIHSAPWSVADQGVRNVSHGCVNLAPADARWLFDTAKIGDPVTVAGTDATLEPGNGWTAWDHTWEEFVAGSALPVPEELATAAGGGPRS